METWKIIIICLSCILIAAGISAAVVIFTNKKSSDDTTTEYSGGGLSYQALTVTYNVTDDSPAHYKLTSLDNVEDRIGAIHTNSNDPDITVWVGDTIGFVKNSSHVMQILSDGGQGLLPGDCAEPPAGGSNCYQLDDGSVTYETDNVGVTFTPKTAGIYYYQCNSHEDMHGKITVDPINTSYSY